MTEEEINKKAEKHCNEVLCNAHEKCYEVIKCRDWRSRRAGFFCGYEQALKDLEKENAELEQKLEQTEKDLADYQFNYPTIKELEKENAELKEKLGDVQMQKAGEKSDLVWKLKTANEQKTGQLTKAKEIIREFVEWATWQGSNCPNFKSIQDKAEQFLNSEVEK